MTVAETAYIAGLIDGEGTITMVRKHPNENRHLAVTISSTERAMLDFVLSTVGVGKITSKRAYKAHHRPSFTYAVHNRQALQLLRQVGPFLLSYKAQRCELALRDYVRLTPRNGKYKPEVLQRRKSFEASFLATKPE